MSKRSTTRKKPAGFLDFLSGNRTNTGYKTVISEGTRRVAGHGQTAEGSQKSAKKFWDRRYKDQ